MSPYHVVLTIPGGADLPLEFHTTLSNQMADEWQSRTAQGFRTFADPIEDTIPDWIKRRDANVSGGDEDDTSTQSPSEEVSNYSCPCCTLRISLKERNATTEDFNAFLSTAAPQALPVEDLSRLRAIFNDASGLTVQHDKNVQVDGEPLRHASHMMLFALEALNFAKRLVVVEVLEKANLKVFGAAAGKRVHGGERLPEGDPNWLKQNLAEYRAYVAQGKGTFAEKMIEKRPSILKGMLVLIHQTRESVNRRKLKHWSVAAKSELDAEPYYKLMWHNAGVEVLDDKTLSIVINDYREKDQAAYGSTTIDKTDEAIRMTALAKHISTLDATVLEDIFGPSAERIKIAIELHILDRVLIEQGEANFNAICILHGGVEGVLKIKESPFASKMPEESPHPVGHRDNPEHTVLDIARLGMAGGGAADSVSEGSFMTMW